MASFPVPTIGGTFGIQPDQELVRVMNRSGARVVGDLVMFDLHQTDAASTTFDVGATTSGFSNVILPATIGMQHGYFGIVTVAAADDAAMTVCVRGLVQAIVVGANLVDEEADRLAAVNGQDNLDSDVQAAGEKLLAIPLEATASGSAETIWVLFDGIHGFGQGAGL